MNPRARAATQWVSPVRTGIAALMSCIVFASSGCMAPARSMQSPNAIETRPPIEGVRRGLGHQCIPYGETRPRGPVIYRTRDIGKRGVPKLDKHEALAVESIAHYIKSEKLRFAILGGGIVIFYAQAGDCVDGAPGYFVLNGACNEYYQPGEDPEDTHPAPGCIGPPRPWIRSDRVLHGDPTAWSRLP